jgi:hypothetical protein
MTCCIVAQGEKPEGQYASSVAELEELVHGIGSETKDLAREMTQTSADVAFILKCLQSLASIPEGPFACTARITGPGRVETSMYCPTQLTVSTKIAMLGVSDSEDGLRNPSLGNVQAVCMDDAVAMDDLVVREDGIPSPEDANCGRRVPLAPVTTEAFVGDVSHVHEGGHEGTDGRVPET